MGGAALHFGWVAEMKTGEGKTLVVDAAGLPQRPQRQGRAPRHRQRLPGPLRRRVDGPASTGWLGLDGRPGHPRRSTTRTRSGAQYACDITYGTNNEFGFDYLRDNMAMTAADKVQRGHTYAIVDEVDSILIDEARTPLIISRPRRPTRPSSTTSSPASSAASSATSTTRSTRRSAPSPPPRRASRRSSRRSASRTSTTRCQPEPRAPAPGRAARPRSCTSGTRTTSSRTAR